MSNWEEILGAKIEALGDSPTEVQQDSLESWILGNVPPAYFSSVAWDLPGHLGTQMSMRSAELGIY